LLKKWSSVSVSKDIGSRAGIYLNDSKIGEGEINKTEGGMLGVDVDQNTPCESCLLNVKARSLVRLI